MVAVSFSQKVTRLVWLDNAEVKDLTQRKLVLCAYTESDAEISRLTAKKAKAKEDKKKAIQEQIEYHEALSKVMKEKFVAMVKANWDMNMTDSVKVLTFSEVSELKKKESKKEAVLYLRYFQKNSADYNPALASIDLATMALQGVEHFGKNNKIIAFPMITSSTDAYNEKDISLTIKLLNNLVKANIAGKKRVDVSDYIDTEIAANCKQKSSLTTYVNKGLLKNVETSELKESYGKKIQSLSNEEFKETYYGTDENLIAVCIPATIAEGSIGPISSAAIIFSRLIINTKTAEIVGYSDFIMGEKAGELMFKKGHFKNMGECK